MTKLAYLPNGKLFSELSSNAGSDLPTIEATNFSGQLDDYYVDAGQLVSKPSKPGEHYTFNYDTKTWIDPRTLDQTKAQQWVKIKNQRALALTAPLSTPYGVFDVDPASRQNITDTIALLKESSPGSTVDFTLYDNSTVTLNQGQMISVGLLLGQQVQAAHATARTLRTQIQAATTIAEVEAIVWPA